MQVKLLDSTVDPLFVISMCARKCYNSRSKDTVQNREKFVKGLIKSGHETPIETAYATFDIDGISRACMAQITRHRIATFCVKSQRYCNFAESEVVIPHKLFIEYPNSIEYVDEMKKIYRDLLKLGVPKEDCRYLLPEGITTSMTMTMNFRSLRHFLKLRLHPTAQWEVRFVAGQILKICIEKWPWLVEDIVYDNLNKNR